jgi:hypothetical protein
MTTKIFKVGQDPTPWITREMAKRMKKWLPEFFKYRGRESKPEPAARYWFDGDS